MKLNYWQSALIMAGVVVVASFSQNAAVFILIVLVGLVLVALNKGKQ